MRYFGLRYLFFSFQRRGKEIWKGKCRKIEYGFCELIIFQGNYFKINQIQKENQEEKKKKKKSMKSKGNWSVSQQKKGREGEERKGKERKGKERKYRNKTIWNCI